MTWIDFTLFGRCLLTLGMHTQPFHLSTHNDHPELMGNRVFGQYPRPPAYLLHLAPVLGRPLPFPALDFCFAIIEQPVTIEVCPVHSAWLFCIGLVSSILSPSFFRCAFALFVLLASQHIREGIYHHPAWFFNRAT